LSTTPPSTEKTLKHLPAIDPWNSAGIIARTLRLLSLYNPLPLSNFLNNTNPMVTSGSQVLRCSINLNPVLKKRTQMKTKIRTTSGDQEDPLDPQMTILMITDHLEEEDHQEAHQEEDPLDHQDPQEADHQEEEEEDHLDHQEEEEEDPQVEDHLAHQEAHQDPHQEDNLNPLTQMQDNPAHLW